MLYVRYHKWDSFPSPNWKYLSDRRTMSFGFKAPKGAGKSSGGTGPRAGVASGLFGMPAPAPLGSPPDNSFAVPQPQSTGSTGQR